MSSSVYGYGGKKIPGYNTVAVPTMDPQTMAHREQVRQRIEPGVYGGLDQYARLAAGDESAYQGIQNRAFEDFNRSLGQIGSRYAGVGSGQMSARNSSAFQNETTGAAGDLAARLQEQRMGIQKDALHELLGLSRDLMSNSPYEYGLMPQKKKRKWWETAIGAGSGIAGGIAGGMFGGLPGAAFGSQVGSQFGSAFLD